MEPQVKKGNLQRLCVCVCGRYWNHKEKVLAKKRIKEYVCHCESELGRIASSFHKIDFLDPLTFTLQLVSEGTAHRKRKNELQKI